MKRVLMMGALALGMLMVSCTDRDRGETPFIPAPLTCRGVSCLSDSDCAAPTPFCRADGSCGECNANEHCETPGMGACRAEGCVCDSDQGCIDSGQGVACSDGLCIACAVDADCTVAGSEKCFDGGTTDAFCGCDGTTTGTVATGCVGEGAQQCGDDGNCIACASDAECTEAGLGMCYGGGAAGAFCGCATDADCDGVCVEGECADVACSSDGDCSNGETCSAAGTADAACICTDDGQCGPGGTCDKAEDATEGTCSTPECVTDGDCMAANNGKCWYAGQNFAYCGCSTGADCSAMGAGSDCRAPDGVCACTAASECTVEAGEMAACRD